MMTIQRGYFTNFTHSSHAIGFSILKHTNTCLLRVESTH